MTTKTPTVTEQDVSRALLAAVRELPMGWLNQSVFPPKKKVIEVFERALAPLAELDLAEHFVARTVLLDMQGIVTGTDPRAGTFKAQSRYAAAKVIDAALRSLPVEN